MESASMRIRVGRPFHSPPAGAGGLPRFLLSSDRRDASQRRCQPVSPGHEASHARRRALGQRSQRVCRRRGPDESPRRGIQAGTERGFVASTFPWTTATFRSHCEQPVGVSGARPSRSSSQQGMVSFGYRSEPRSRLPQRSSCGRHSMCPRTAICGAPMWRSAASVWVDKSTAVSLY